VTLSEPLPARVGPYRVEAELGRGMMGVVYRARDTRRGRRQLVALKVIRMTFAVSSEQRDAFERRFLEEARIVSRLHHPGIVAIHDVGRDRKQDAPYIAFEYLQGRTLSALLDAGQRPDWREALRLVARLAEALDYAHGQGVVHRDLKPANVMVLPSGEPKLMDFGLAKAEAGLELTSTGQFMGTPLYMAPEQALGEPVDRRTDLFSLGSVAYTLLTGRRAFEAESVPQVLNRAAYWYPPPPSTVMPSLPADADYVLGRAMAKRRADRYPDGRTMAEDIADLLDGRPPRHRGGWSLPQLAEGTIVSLGRAEDLPELELVEPPPRRRRGLAATLAPLLGLVALAGVLVTTPFWRAQLSWWWGTPEAAAPVPAPASPVPPPAADKVVASATEAGDDPAPDAMAGSGARESWSAAVEPSFPLGPHPTLAPQPSPAVLVGAAAAASPPAPVPSRPASAPAASPATSRLSVRLEHGLRSGTVRVLVDRKLVLDQRLTSRVTKDLLLFKLRSGSVRDVLPVVPGRRRVRVEIHTDGTMRAREIEGTFRPGLVGRLEVKVARSGEPSLAWK
jgi:eukaryotic-like serine/threonine-protein kinase